MNVLIYSLPSVTTALCLTLMTWGVTALGAASVFFFNGVSARLLNMLTGFGAGVMIASSFWSLLLPALENESPTSVMLVSLGFILGSAFILAADRLFDLFGFEQRFGRLASSRRRSLMLILAVTVHNIPEGLAVGVAVGSAALADTESAMLGAIALAAGIALQNFPEGASVALPLRREGMGPGRCFFYGQLSGMPEPVAGVIGAVLALWIGPALPLFLAFAAGAMIAVVTSELIPACAAESKGSAVVGVTAGFIIMMVLDVLI